MNHENIRSLYSQPFVENLILAAEKLSDVTSFLSTCKSPVSNEWPEAVVETRRKELFANHGCLHLNTVEQIKAYKEALRRGIKLHTVIFSLPMTVKMSEQIGEQLPPGITVLHLNRVCDETHLEAVNHLIKTAKDVQMLRVRDVRAPIRLLEWPNSVRLKVQFGVQFDQSLAYICFPANIYAIKFDSLYNRSLKDVQWPVNLRQIILPRAHENISDLNLPDSLKILHLGVGYNFSADNGFVLPTELEQLSLNYDFDMPLDRVRLPVTLKRIDVSNEYKHSLNFLKDTSVQVFRNY